MRKKTGWADLHIGNLNILLADLTAVLHHRGQIPSEKEKSMIGSPYEVHPIKHKEFFLRQVVDRFCKSYPCCLDQST